MQLPTSQNSGFFQQGFTMIELMVVMTVMAVLATMVLFGLGRAQASARDASRQQIMTGVQTALERFYADYQAYPSTSTTPASANNTFCGIVFQLVSLSYLSSSPVDPNTKAQFCTAANGTGTVGGATYAYGNQVASQCGTGTLNTTYQLTLTKESGGASYFCSPQ